MLEIFPIIMLILILRSIYPPLVEGLAQRITSRFPLMEVFSLHSVAMTTTSSLNSVNEVWKMTVGGAEAAGQNKDITYTHTHQGTEVWERSQQTSLETTQWGV